MYVNHSGWNETQGFFNYDIFVDEKREDYELRFADGSKARQCSSFHNLTGDWNNDGDVYTQFGAFFTKDGRYSEFWTPENMVMALIEGREGDRSRDNSTVVEIPGVDIPEKNKRPKLEDKIRTSEARAMHRECEKNRAMKHLGIRSPGDPWAR